MPYINYAKVNAQRSAKSSAVTSVTKSFSSIPWEKVYQLYLAAADEWEDTATAAQHASADEKYKYYLSMKALEAVTAESGAYEGNIADEHVQNAYPPLPGKAKGRRKAGLKAVVDNFLNVYKFGDWSTTIMPDIITKIGNMSTAKNDNGLISGKRFVKDNFRTDADRGLWVFLMLDSRGSYLPTQYRGTAKQYSALVPLIPYAQRLLHGTPYSAWDPAEIHQVVNEDLADAMLFRAPEDQWPDKDHLISGRVQGLTVQTGKDKGKLRSAQSTWKLYATTGTCYQGMPHLTQVMLAQIWVAHPENRTKYMVLDPLNWDRVPPPLIETDIFQKPVYETSVAVDTDNDLPWM